MIHTIYDHGGDDPATGLSPAQLSGALKDAAGTLWVDLEAASAAERETVLVQALGLEPAGSSGGTLADLNGFRVGSRHIRLTANVPSEGGEVAATTLYLGSNFVVTVQPGIRFVSALRNQSTQGLRGGAGVLAARIMTDAAGAWVLRLNELQARLGEFEGQVMSGGGRAMGRAIYGVRRELEELSHALPVMAANCRALASDAQSTVAPTARPAFDAAADVLVREGIVAERLATRADLALAAHAADLAAATFGAIRWTIVATLAAGAAVATAVFLAAGR